MCVCVCVCVLVGVFSTHYKASDTNRVSYNSGINYPELEQISQVRARAHLRHQS